ncbi:MAG: hypothetical protein ACTSQG_12085 [Promethearchaeota archaeon]
MENLIQLLLDNLWTVIGLVVGIFGVGSWAKIRFFSEKGSVLFRELGELFLSGADVMDQINKDIADDGKLDGKEIRDIVQVQGKTLIKEFRDVKIIIKPKKTAKSGG